ncbi:energy transducer TonB [Trichlorobacter ammonificans]|uniref:TolA protein n=1 Tax=Trichlorobacter ammonificans TaxID=2916410 RepID=A0ABM9D4I9_9BACT|nr:energy transducer TonB [Trichlorobacter ammonificans]CAH2030139.1 Putative TolA protein [Trichlorobacter ammonificans]
MQRVHPARDSRFAVSMTLSLLLHAVLFTALIWWQQVTADPGPVQTTYYVDVVNLPVADPRAGSPLQSASSEEVAPPPPEPAAIATPTPTPPAPRVPAQRQAAARADVGTFDQRLAKLQSIADSRRQAQRLEELRAKVAAGGRSGMPKGTGTEAGSDYTAYLHSRLKDAFRETISYQSTAPFVAVRLTIDGTGKLLRSRFEKSSNDKMFELSVRRAISLAEPSFGPPPGRSQYEGVFVFRPEGVVQQ